MLKLVDSLKEKQDLCKPSKYLLITMVVLTYILKLFDTFPSPPHECELASNRIDESEKVIML